MGAQAYDWNDKYGDSSIKQTAQAALSLSQKFIDNVRESPYHKDPKLCLTHEMFNVIGAETAENWKPFQTVRYILCSCIPHHWGPQLYS